MPIDPRIAMGFQSPQFEQPINVMGNFLKLKSMQQQNALAEQQMADLERQRSQNAFLNQAYSEAIDPQTGAVDYNELIGATARGGYGSLAPGLLKSKLESDEQTAKTRSAELKLFGDALGARRQVLGMIKTPEQFLAWHEGNHTDSVIGPMLDKMGIKPEDSRATIIARLEKGELPQLLAESSLSMEEMIKNTKLVDTMDKGIPVTQSVTPSGQTLWQRTTPPKSPAVQVNVGKAESKFGETVATGVGQNIIELQKNASSAIDSFNQNQGLYQYINSKDFISGTLGEPRLAIAKFLGLKGADETQVYMSQVGREVGNIVKMFGSGTAISEGDRKAAEKIAGGSMELTPQAIRSIMFIRQKANRHAAVRYNEELEKLRNNPRTAQGVEFLSSVPVPPPPAFNDKGWALWYDSKNKAYAYVSPDKKQVQETE